MICANEGHKKVGTLVGALYGDAYQIHLLMLLYERAFTKNDCLDFNIATEWKAADKFDDAILSWKASENNCERNWLFIRVKFKHKLMLKLPDILPTEQKCQTSGDFSLFKYFASFCTIENNSSFSGHKQYVIYTNAKVDPNTEVYFAEADSRIDNAANLLGAGSRFLKFKASDEQTQQLLDFANQDFNTLADQLKSIFWDNLTEFDVSLFGKYRGALNFNVLVVKDGTVHFAPRFINNKKLNQSEALLRLEIMEQGKTYDMLKSMKTENKQLADILTSKCQSESLLPTRTEKSTVERYLQQLTFAVSQPDYKKLEHIIKTEFQKLSLRNDSYSISFGEMMYTKLQQMINRNLDAEEVEFLRHDQLQNQIDEVFRIISGPKLTTYTEVFQAKMQNLRLKFDQNCLPMCLNFIEQHTAILTSTEQGLLTSLKVYQVLENLNYRYFSLQDLQLVALHEELCSDLCSCKSDLYLVLKDDCTSKFESSTAFIESVASNKHVKIILLSYRKEFVSEFFGKHTFQQITDHSEMRQLTFESQQKLLQRTILFQGVEMKLAELPLTEKNIALPIKNEIFEKLIQDETVEVGPALPEQKIRYYIPRTIGSRQLSFSAEDTDSSESDPDDTDNDGTNNFNEVEFVSVSHGTVAVLSSTPGMGKSTLWLRLTQVVKKLHNSKWVLYIRLVDCLELLTSATKNITSDELVQLLQNIFKFKSEFTRSLLEQFLFFVPDSVYIFFDGFDELPLEAMSRAVRLFQRLSNTRMFINTRTHCQTILEKDLHVQIYSLEPISRKDQTELFRTLIDLPAAESKEFKSVNDFVNRLVDKLHSDPIEIASKFVGVPLLINMLAEVYKPTIDAIQLQHDPAVFNAVDLGSLNIIDIFEMFVYHSFQSEYVEKHSLDKHTFHTQQLLDKNNILYQGFLKLHNFVGLASLVTPEKMKLIYQCKQDLATLKQQMVQLLDSKIVPKRIDKVPNFIHAAIAEFFAARCLFEKLERMTPEHAKKSFVVSEQNRAMKKKSYIKTTLDLYHQVLRDYTTVRKFFFLLAKQNEKIWNKLESLLWCMRPYSLLWACEQNFEQLVKRLLENDPSIATFQTKDKKTPLHFAVGCGDPTICRLLIDHQANVTARNKYGRVPLHVAAQTGHYNVVELLIAKGAMVDAVDNQRQTPLMLAAYAGHFDVGRVLTEAHCNVNRLNKRQWNALHLAALRGHTDIVHLLIACESQLKVGKASNWLMFLGQLISSNHHDVVRALVQYEVASSKTIDDFVQTYRWAIRCDNVNIIRTILKEGRKPNGVGSIYLNTYKLALEHRSFKVAELILNAQSNLDELEFPLHAAVEAGSFLCTRILLDKKAEVNAVNEKGKTPLDVALAKGRSGITLLLLHHDARMNKISMYSTINSSPNCGQFLIGMANRNDVIKAIDRDSRPTHCSYWLAAKLGLSSVAFEIFKFKDDLKLFRNPLHAAAIAGGADLTYYLLDKNSDVDAIDENGRRPLDLAINYGHAEIVEALLKHSAKLRETSLHRAVEVDSYKSVVLLLAHGANPNATNENGRTALHITAFFNYLEMSSILLQYGASIIKDVDSRTPLHLAAVQNAHQVTERLIKHKLVKDYIDEPDIMGQTALHFAAIYNSYDVAVLLIDAGANVNFRDNKQRTPLHLASAKGIGNISRLLLSRKADSDATDCNGLTFKDYPQLESKSVSHSLLSPTRFLALGQQRFWGFRKTS